MRISLNLSAIGQMRRVLAYLGIASLLISSFASAQIPSPTPAPAGVVLRSEKIADGIGKFPAGLLHDDDRFGDMSSAIGDIDRDGIIDIAV